jgi:acylphosphatase
MIVGRLCIVSGRVQGVFFRDSTRKMAIDLGVNGYAKNLSDGSVEVLACGEEGSVNQLCDWLWQGPPQSRVTQVVCEKHQDYSVDGFMIG